MALRLSIYVRNEVASLGEYRWKGQAGPLIFLPTLKEILTRTHESNSFKSWEAAQIAPVPQNDFIPNIQHAKRGASKSILPATELL